MLGPIGRLRLLAVAALVGWLVHSGPPARAQSVRHEVLAFYYGWYGNPAITGGWVHWHDVDAPGRRIANATDFPVLGAYDSHDPAIVEQQVATARSAGITGFIASWWGQGSFEDQGIALLLSAAAKHGLAVTAYVEKIEGADEPARIRTAVGEFDYLLARYGTNKAWLRAGGQPVLFVYGRAVHALSSTAWQQVIRQVRSDNAGGVRLIVDALKPDVVQLFDGASAYNITGQIQHKTPEQVRVWARATYPQMVAAAGPGRISTVTVIPGYDDRKLGHPPPRPVTERWGGAVYDALWQEAIAAHPDYVLITSWNEWHEGSELEASVEYGTRILDDTAAFAREFLAGAR